MPYPNFNIKSLRDDAAKKNVQIIMCNGTCGSAKNNPGAYTIKKSKK